MYKYIKRILDILFSLLLLILLSPLMLLTAAVIRVESKGPAFFRQERIGLNMRIFRIFKFRSMRQGAESGGVYTKKGDPRVTRTGRLIRATSIDELPQLINILKGDMSVIGPRPPLTYHPWPAEEYTAEQKKRFAVRPGLTGWAQVNGRKDLHWNRRIEYDLRYVRNMSFFLDARIFFITIVKVLTIKDNYNNSETA